MNKQAVFAAMSLIFFFGFPQMTPNAPKQPLDPLGPTGKPPAPKPQLCKTVTKHQCMNYQGNPPHCTRYQDTQEQVCSPNPK